MLADRRPLLRPLPGSRLNAPLLGKKEDQLKASIDKRRLRRTGRTELWSFRTRPDLKKRAYELAKEKDMLISEFMQNALEAYIETLKGGK